MSRCPNCEKAARREVRERKARGELAQGQPDRNGRLVNFTEEERKRRSDLAKRLHAEGRFGGATIGQRGGQAVGRHRITDAVLEHFRQPDMQALVIKAYESNLKGKSKPGRLQAAEALRKAETAEEERMRADRGGAVDPASLTDDQLVELVAQGLETLLAAGETITLGDDAVEDVT